MSMLSYEASLAYLCQKARISRGLDTLADVNEQAIAPLLGDVGDTYGKAVMDELDRRQTPVYPLDHKPYGWRSLWAKSGPGTGLDEGLAWRYSENYRRLRGTDDSGPTIGVDAASLDQEGWENEGGAQLKELLDSVQQVCDEAKAKWVSEQCTVPPPPPLKIDEA